MVESAHLRLHVDDPMLFREAITFTASEARFAPRLIEKDYFCSVILQHLAAAGAGLVFRGGTCLAKVHADFYRLSEDLDFLIPTPMDGRRADRRRSISACKRAIADIDEALLGLHVTAPFTGANDSRQYVGVIGYETLVSPNAETIKVEVGLREPLLAEPVHGNACTLLRDPVSGMALIQPVRLQCIARREAMAEKLRAALSRREAAIRDFYDVDHAVRTMGLRPDDEALIELVKRKLAVPGNASVDVTTARLKTLRRQAKAELKPVLRDPDFEAFDLERAFAVVVDVARRVAAAS